MHFWSGSGVNSGFDRLVCAATRSLVVLRFSSHNGNRPVSGVVSMTFYTCFDPQGQMIARCQTPEDIQVLKRMGRPIADVQPMRSEEAVVCSLTGSPSEFDEEY